MYSRPAALSGRCLGSTRSLHSRAVTSSSIITITPLQRTMISSREEGSMERRVMGGVVAELLRKRKPLPLLERA
jgi:hypothetical protein